MKKIIYAIEVFVVIGIIIFCVFYFLPKKVTCTRVQKDTNHEIREKVIAKFRNDKPISLKATYDITYQNLPEEALMQEDEQMGLLKEGLMEYKGVKIEYQRKNEKSILKMQLDYSKITESVIKDIPYNVASMTDNPKTFQTQMTTYEYTCK